MNAQEAAKIINDVLDDPVLVEICQPELIKIAQMIQKREPTVVVVMDGGCIHEVQSNIPNVRVMVVDYDVEGLDPDRIEKDPNGVEICATNEEVNDLDQFNQKIVLNHLAKEWENV